jgi:hypothetical protein
MPCCYNVVRLTRLNRLFDHWVALDPTILGIRKEHVYQILLQTDTCSFHTLEKYRFVLDGHPENQGENRILSRGAFLSMFQHERSAVIHAMISLVDKCKKKRGGKKKPQLSSSSRLVETDCQTSLQPRQTTSARVEKQVWKQGEELMGSMIVTREGNVNTLIETPQIPMIEGGRPRAYTEQKTSYHRTLKSKHELPAERDCLLSVHEINIDCEVNNRNKSKTDASKKDRNRERRNKSKVRSKLLNYDPETDSTCTFTQTNEEHSISSISMQSMKNYDNSPSTSFREVTEKQHKSAERVLSNHGRQRHRNDRQDAFTSSSRYYDSLHAQSKVYQYPSKAKILNHNDPQDYQLSSKEDLVEDYSCFFLDGIISFFQDLFNPRPK